MNSYWLDELRNDDTVANIIASPHNGILPGIRTDAGVGSFWIPTAEEKAAIADDQPVLLWFPKQQDHPGVIVHALTDPAEEDSRDIPVETEMARVLLVGGPLDGEYRAASYGRARIYYPGPDPMDPEYPADPALDSSYELYCHIPGDPENEYRHAATYIQTETPGIDYSEKNVNMSADREAVEAWRVQSLASYHLGIVPPQVDDVDVPAGLFSAHLAHIRFNVSVPHEGP